MSIADEDLNDAIEQTRAKGHTLEDALKPEGRTLSLYGKRLHGAIAKAGEYQSTEINRNRSMLEEIDVRAAYYDELQRKLDEVKHENRNQRRLVAAALKGAIAGQAALDAELVNREE